MKWGRWLQSALNHSSSRFGLRAAKEKALSKGHSREGLMFEKFNAMRVYEMGQLFGGTGDGTVMPNDDRPKVPSDDQPNG